MSIYTLWELVCRRDTSKAYVPAWHILNLREVANALVGITNVGAGEKYVMRGGGATFLLCGMYKQKIPPSGGFFVSILDSN